MTSPAEGTNPYETQTIVYVTVEPVDPNLYAFSHWEGTAVDAGKVSHHETLSATVTVDGQYTLKACFVSLMDILCVDDDAVEDVEPNDLTISDPQEDGTPMHPLDSIQEAIEVAAPGGTIVVRPGTYYEIIDFLGKSIQLTGIDPNDPNAMSFPVIDATGQGPAVTFARGEDPHCSLTGFVITRGRGHPAGAPLLRSQQPNHRQLSNRRQPVNRPQRRDGLLHRE